MRATTITTTNLQHQHQCIKLQHKKQCKGKSEETNALKNLKCRDELMIVFGFLFLVEYFFSIFCYIRKKIVILSTNNECALPSICRPKIQEKMCCCNVDAVVHKSLFRYIVKNIYMYESIAIARSKIQCSWKQTSLIYKFDL